jgi:hypothetical protein
MTRHTEDQHCELRALSEHLLYEIERLDQNAGRILALLEDQSAVAEKDRYALLESFLLHARNLYEFLFLKKGKGDKNALRANDFMEDKPYAIPTPDSELERWAKYMIDRRLVHLSQQRLIIDTTDAEWKVGILLDQIYQQLLEFYDWVEDEHICELLRLRKNRALHDAFNKEAKGEPMFDNWTCNVVMGTASPSLPVIVTNPIGFPVERDE